ncbi:hypothetical protein SBA5_110076 [Candidatus Sulfotelmatomonas gaucii]|uniref:Uncharacterized protein n=1 Tax=Candidatus Sulfuritelmatomonas gaucii TaxID=2043161 RepID=A0A2N9L308_9BACT|nr:hypothetical protein SBA5_110076 [Candidatus Sulfotelmatomonas gaucii]
MDHKIHIVEQDPLAVPATLHRVRIDAEVALEAQFDFIGNGDGLPLIGGRGDKEEISEAGIDGIEFKDPCVLAFFFFTGRGGGLYEDARFLLRGRYVHASKRFSKPMVVQRLGNRE